MNRRLATLLATPLAVGALALGSAPAQSAPLPGAASLAQGSPANWGASKKPSKVVIIVVDALSREIVQKYKMRNIQKLMADGVDAPNSYNGHVGSVTVVTHNVITSGKLPKNSGYTDEGYRDVDGVLGEKGKFYITSNFGKDEMFAVQKHAGSPKLADYLHQAKPGSKVYTISPKGYAAYAFGGSGSDSIITFGSKKDCPDGNKYRSVGGVNVPAYLTQECGRFFVHQLSAGAYDTSTWPASLYPLDGDRYTEGKDPAHLGGDVWAADAAIEVMKNDPKWSGVFVSLPGVDKAAHMWGGVDDPGGADPMTHMPVATKTADEQVGKIMDHLRTTNQLKDTLVVLTADHGSVPARNFYGTKDTTLDYGYYNWYYGEVANDSAYLKPQEALKPLVNTGNVGMTYSDSMMRVWLKDTSRAKVNQAAGIMANMPKVTAVYVRNGSTYRKVNGPNWKVMGSLAEKAWFTLRAQELVNTSAAPYGPDVIATLADDTTYSVAGDHGGIQRRTQQIPITFAGGNLSSRDTLLPVRSVDIMPTILKTMGIPATSRFDGFGYVLPTK